MPLPLCHSHRQTNERPCLHKILHYLRIYPLTTSLAACCHCRRCFVSMKFIYTCKQHLHLHCLHSRQITAMHPEMLLRRQRRRRRPPSHHCVRISVRVVWTIWHVTASFRHWVKTGTSNAFGVRCAMANYRIGTLRRTDCYFVATIIGSDSAMRVNSAVHLLRVRWWLPAIINFIPNASAARCAINILVTAILMHLSNVQSYSGEFTSLVTSL